MPLHHSSNGGGIKTKLHFFLSNVSVKTHVSKLIAEKKTKPVFQTKTLFDNWIHYFVFKMSLYFKTGQKMSSGGVHNGNCCLQIETVQGNDSFVKLKHETSQKKIVHTHKIVDFTSLK